MSLKSILLPMEITYRFNFTNFLNFTKKSKPFLQQVPMAEDEAFEDIAESDETKQPPFCQRIADSIRDAYVRCIDGAFGKFEGALESTWGPIQEMSMYKDSVEFVWSIDAYARCFFPVVFFILQIIYWTCYLYVM